MDHAEARKAILVADAQLDDVGDLGKKLHATILPRRPVDG